MAVLSVLDVPNLTQDKFFEVAEEYFGQLKAKDAEDPETPFMSVSLKNGPFDMLEKGKYMEVLKVDKDNDDDYGFTLVVSNKDRRDSNESNIAGLIDVHVINKKINTGVIDPSDNYEYIEAAAGFLKNLSWNTEIYYYDPCKHEENGLVTRYGAEESLKARLEKGFIPSIVVALNDKGLPSVNGIDEMAMNYFGFVHIYAAINPVVEKRLGLTVKNPKFVESARFYGRNLSGELDSMSAALMREAIFDAYDEAEVDEKLVNLANDLGQNIDDYRKDAEIKELKELNDEYCKENQTLAEKNQELTERIRSIETEVENLKALSVRPNYTAYNKPELGLGIVSTEKDLYNGEIKDILLKLINKEIKTMDGLSTRTASRKYIVLKDIADNNQLTGEDERLSQFIKETVGAKDFHVNAAFRGKLKSEGFNIDETGTHPRIWLGDDERFSCTLSGSPGDYRASMNTASDFKNLLFGN